MNTSKIDWKKVDNLIPAIIQDNETNTVLMLGYMNKEALEKTFETRKVWFFSRTKGRLWMKGETSNNTLELVEAKLDCDNDTLLIKVRPNGPTCHKLTDTCFGETRTDPGIFAELYSVIKSRKRELPEKSYTTSLFKEGVNKICAKVEEESGEVIQAAKKESQKRLTEESIDLIYHLFVLLAQRDIDYVDIVKETRRRRK